MRIALLHTTLCALGALVLTSACATAPAPERAGDDATGAAPAPASHLKADSDEAPADCAFDPDDPFEPRERLPKGQFRGQCYDTRVARSVRRLDTETAATYGAEPGELVLANVHHAGRFWVARVPLAGVEQVLFHLEYFPAIVPAGHAQLRVRFAEATPVRLISQSLAEAPAETTLTDLVLSLEAIGQPGYKYDIVRGVLDDFGAAYRVVSLADKMQHMIVRQHHKVEQWGLLLEGDEAATLLERFAEAGETRRMQTMYNTLFVNCTNEAVRILDEAVHYTFRQQVQRFLAKVTEFYPNIVRAALEARGLVPRDHSTDWPYLADDPTAAGLVGPSDDVEPDGTSEGVDVRQAFVGDACETDADCAFTVDDVTGRCHAAGFCTLPCQGYCPDAEGAVGTFCAADPTASAPAGICVPLAVPENGHCADLPGTFDASATRFVGAADAPAGEAEVCLPRSAPLAEHSDDAAIPVD
jgi:hypothetical protein